MATGAWRSAILPSLTDQLAALKPERAGACSEKMTEAFRHEIQRRPSAAWPSDRIGCAANEREVRVKPLRALE